MIIIKTNYQKGKIVVEELRKFYSKMIMLIGLFIVLMIKNLILFHFYFTEENSSGLISSLNPLEILLIIGIIFALIILYNYYKLYKLKKAFKNSLDNDIELKKYMKMDDIPTKEDVIDKFLEDKNDAKKKFRRRIARIVITMIVLILVDAFYIRLIFLDLILVFAAFDLYYRHLYVYHFDEMLFNEEWENKKLQKLKKEFLS